MNKVEKLKNKVLRGGVVSKEEAMYLLREDIDDLSKAANEIREHFVGNRFDVCTIINGKSGLCTEDCKFCAQSSHYHSKTEEYPLLGVDELMEGAKYNAERGILRYSVVTSGRNLEKNEVESIANHYKKIREEVDIRLCASHGLLSYEDFKLLKQSGVERYHNNLETSRNFFPSICSTHSYDEKVEAIKAAKKAGLKVCSGGILGLGESEEDRVDMALELRNLEADSIPINILNPIPGTPFENQKQVSLDDLRRTVAIYRFIHPGIAIRLAGGRGLLEDYGRSVFLSGANAVISGDMLTTAGVDIQSDMNLIQELGFKVELI